LLFYLFILSYNDVVIVKLNLDDDDDDDAQDNTGENDDDEAQENTMENVNLNENNIDETSHFLDEEKPPADPTLAP